MLISCIGRRGLRRFGIEYVWFEGSNGQLPPTKKYRGRWETKYLKRFIDVRQVDVKVWRGCCVKRLANYVHFGPVSWITAQFPHGGVEFSIKGG